MPVFKYIARDATGQRIDGTLTAADRNQAMRQLQQAGHTPLALSQTAPKTARQPATKQLNFKLTSGRTARLRPRAMLLFSREMADLLASGMTLGRALHTLARRNAEPTYKTIVSRLRDEVVQGSSLSDALQIFPESFPPLYISMIRVGEAGGALAEALAGLCTHYDRVQQARNKVISAMVYPGIILSFGTLSVILLMVFIVPKFSTIFDDLGGAMPLPTRILMGVSNGLIHYGWLLALLVVAGAIALRQHLKTETGKRWKDRWQLKLPVVSKIARANAFAHFARTLETLMHNGVPILKALTISGETVGNYIIAAEISEARNRVTDGSSIAGPLAAGGVFPELFTDMLSVGEETGDLPGALAQIARRYDEELDFSIKLLTTVLEPILILGMGLLIGFVAISMLMAVFDLTSGLSA